MNVWVKMCAMVPGIVGPPRLNEQYQGPVLSAFNVSTFLNSEHGFIQNISCDVSPGEIIGIIGLNGSGKSTLLKALSGLIRVQQSVRWAGIDCQQLSFAQRAAFLSYVPQYIAGSWPYTVQELLEQGFWYATHYFGAPRLPVSDLELLLDRVGLSSTFLNRYFDTLSGGEQRLVLLARSFAQQPQVYAWDEPMNTIDRAKQMMVWKQLRFACMQGASALVVLHDLNLAASGCDRILVMKDLSMFACDTPERIVQPALLHSAMGLMHTIYTSQDLMP